MKEVCHESGLVWWPSEGMGYFPVPPGHAPYDRTYWMKYVGYASTPMGRAINRKRLDLVRQWLPTDALLDVGIGCGAFINGRGPGTFGYDVNPVAIEWLKSHDLWLDPYISHVKHASCFDSLEHIADPGLLVDRVKGTIFISTPIYTDFEYCLHSKHFRRDEHYWYWTSWGLVKWMLSRGFALDEKNTMEVDAGRESIGTFVFHRR